MKNSGRKARIREMLNAEGLLTQDKTTPNASWNRFKREFQTDATTHTPQLEILPPREKSLARYLLPVAALVVAGVVFFLWRWQTQQATLPTVAQAEVVPKTAARTFSKGDVYRSGKREILLMAGDAQLTETAGKVRIAATTLTADFRLRERVDMQIEHPLITVTITGTEFLFAVTPKGGSIDLRHGSLAIDLKQEHSGRIRLRAPAKLVFTVKSHEVISPDKSGRSDSKPLYRYELLNGETFFAYQVQVSPPEHRVQLLGGGAQTVAVRDIASVSLAERE